MHIHTKPWGNPQITKVLMNLVISTTDPLEMGEGPK
jgi:hypothetical protein